MTNPDYTAILFDIDKSGSMWDIKTDMEGGINTVLEEQKKLPGKVTVDVAYFSNTTTYEDTFLSLDDTKIEIKPGGMTALYDSIVISTTKFGEALAALPEDERPGTVLVVVVTDGLENVSREATVEDVKRVITEQQDTYGWEFVFLGANQDAIETGETFGLRKGASMTYTANAAGTMDASNFINATITSARTRIN
jgi:hypothetical protein